MIVDKVIELWQECFHDDSNYVKSFWDFASGEKSLNCLTGSKGLDSMLFAVDYDFSYYGDKIPFSYICSIATREDRRNKGLAGRLIEDSLKKLCRQGKVLCGLIAATDDLCKFYEKKDFVSCCTGVACWHETIRDDSTDFRVEECDLEKFLVLKAKCFESYDCELVHDSRTMVLYRDNYYHKLLIYKGEDLCALAVAVDYSTHVTLVDLQCKEVNLRSGLAEAVSRYYDRKIFYNSHHRSDKTLYGLEMLRILDVKRALELYARRNPELCRLYSVQDNIIASNTGFYRLENGKVEKKQIGCEKEEVYKSLSVSELCEEIFYGSYMRFVNEE